jgi:tetratricopeptide (TPR) repeat protein
VSQIFSSPQQARFIEAVRLHQSGRLAEAERIYRQILDQDQNHPDALHMLGVIASQTGHFAESVTLIGQALAVNPQAAPFHANYGTALRGLGRLQDAAAAFRRALHYKPDYAEAHNNLGTTLRDLGNIEEAEASFREALRLKPDHGDAHNNLGNLKREAGQWGEAEEHYRQALAVMPLGHPKTMHYNRNLGTLLRDCGRLTEAEASYRRALRIKADDEELHNNLGIALREMGLLLEADRSHSLELLLAPDLPSPYNSRGASLRALGRLDDAERLARRALIIAPNLAEAHNTLGIVLFDLGKIDSARHHLDQALALAPGDALFHFNLAATKRYRLDDPQIGVMEAMLPRAASLPIDARIHLNFALAKAYDDLGDKDRGFDHLLTGNGLKRQQLGYDEAAAMALFARIKALFTADLMRELALPAQPASGAVFILGMPRSGSTLIEQILASHPQMFGAGELTLLSQSVNAVLGRDRYPEAVSALNADGLAALAETYRTALQTEAQSSLRITDKLLRNFIYCGLIALALPEARIIHCSRDPIDNCLSIYSKLFVGHHPYAYDLAELGRYYLAYQDLMAHWRRVLPPGRMIDVVYEDVVEDLEGQARRLLDFLELPWDPACLAFYNTNRPVRTASATQVRQPIYRSSVGRWRPSGDRLSPLLRALGSEALSATDPTALDR